MALTADPALTQLIKIGRRYVLSYRLRVSYITAVRHLVAEVPQPDGGVVAGGDAELFDWVSSQTPDPSPAVAVQQQVGRCVLLPDLDDLPVLRANQNLSLEVKKRSWCEEDATGGECSRRVT